MSVTQVQIDEYDSVALTEPTDGWNSGTLGVVQGVRGSEMLVEVTDYDAQREFLDHIFYVQVNRLRLVRKHRRPDAD
jgi:hypothetical protein